MAALLAPKPRKGRTRSRPRVRRVWVASLVIDAVLVAGVLAAFSLRPAPAGAEPAVDGAPLEQHIALGYEADVDSTETYPDGRIETGDTVFRNLADSVDVFARTAGPDGVAVDGFVRIDLTVTSSAGWERTAPLVARTELDDDLAVSAPLLFAQVDRVAARIALETGISPGTLDLAVALTGEARIGDGEPVALEVTLPLRLSAQTATHAGGEITDTDDGPVVAAAVELAPAPAGDDQRPDDERPDLTRPALGALLLGVGMTAVVWPTGQDDEDDPGAVVRIRTTDLYHPLSASSVEVAGQADVEGIARQAHAPILCRDDGWQGVVSAEVLYWTPSRSTATASASGGSGARR